MAALVGCGTSMAAAAEGPDDWRGEFPRTDIARHSMAYDEIVFDGARRDSIPPISARKFVDAASVRDIGPFEPVLSLIIDGDARAYPLQILLWHEIVNDIVGGVPVLISYCPLCNSGIVFDRRLDGRTLEFGNTGRIRHFDMVMYDIASESWWQQFGGIAIMGTLTGKALKPLPSRLESLARFRQQAPAGRLFVPDDADARPYGITPYVDMETTPAPRRRFPYPLPPGVETLSRVVIVGEVAWPLDRVRQQRRLEHDDLIIEWEPGQNSIHDTQVIAFGRDVGNVTVRRRTGAGLVDVPYDVTFAFAAFVPGGILHRD